MVYGWYVHTEDLEVSILYRSSILYVCITGCLDWIIFKTGARACSPEALHFIHTQEFTHVDLQICIQFLW